eukprot:4325633-Prymnesium_polylepis.1
MDMDMDMDMVHGHGHGTWTDGVFNLWSVVNMTQKCVPARIRPGTLRAASRWNRHQTVLQSRLPSVTRAEGVFTHRMRRGQLRIEYGGTACSILMKRYAIHESMAGVNQAYSPAVGNNKGGCAAAQQLLPSRTSDSRELDRYSLASAPTRAIGKVTSHISKEERNAAM